jgi:pheromone shutdown protein TraB
MISIASAAVGAGCIPLLPANGANLVTSTAVCDPTVSVWKRNGRFIYLLGTAHISADSARLAGTLVQSVHPNGVFVELDPKRVSGSGILAKKVNGVDGEEEGPTSRVIVPNIQRVVSIPPPSSSQLLASADGTQPPVTTKAPPADYKPNPIMRAASVALGNSLKGMYKKMDSAGFQSGEEFVVAIREGQNIGSAIVLGDRDVEVTLGRLTDALARTDLKALMNPDSELEQSLKELVPNQMSSNGGGDLNDEQFREEFSSFVEVMKAKDNVKKIMSELQRVAPALYEALVSERDAYMAAGLNGLDELETIVAVMGIAHVDGVEQNLKLNGWQSVTPICAARS